MLPLTELELSPTMDDIESFSDHESPTAIFPDRPTPDYEAPSGLLRFAGGAAPSALETLPLTTAKDPPEAMPAAPRPEDEFFDSDPRYSTTSVRPLPLPTLRPAQQPSPSRRNLARALFASLLLAVLALLVYEAAVIYRIGWSEIRELCSGRVVAWRHLLLH